MSLSSGLNVFETPKCHVLLYVFDVGYNCEENVDGCHPNPCVHGKCIDQVGGYQCVCHPPYSGLNCSVYWILACRISVGMVPRVFQMPRTAHSLASVPPDTLVTAAVHINNLALFYDKCVV